MSYRRLLTRWHGVRVWIKWDAAKKIASVIPDEGDLASIDPLSLMRFWDQAAQWSREFLARYPGYRINGNHIDSRDEDEFEI